MEQHHSTLELVKHDETAKAPERDHDATAFELDASALAPQVAIDTVPQVLYDSSFPEVFSAIQDSPESPVSSHHNTKAARKWPWMVVTLVVVAAIAVGAGIGTWRHRERSSELPSSTISPSVPQNHSSTPAPQYILNDTSLAALSLANGDRQLFFQDNSGVIQRAVRSASNGQWSTRLRLNITTSAKTQPQPKINTPLALIVYEVKSFNTIEVFYVSDSHHLVSEFLNISDTFVALPPIPITGNNYSTAVDTRSLSVTPIPGSYSENIPADFTANTALLYYENATGNVSALLRRLIADNEMDVTLPWFDITSQNEHHGNLSDAPRVDEFSNGPNFPSLVGSHTLYESVASTKVSTPFTCKANFSGDPNGGSTSIGALFYAPGNSSFVIDVFVVGPSGPGNYTEYDSFGLTSHDTLVSGAVGKASGKDSNYSFISQSDVATVGRFDAIWINGTQPVTLVNAPPNISFPFTRLASLDSADQTTTFLYHQINGTTFAEEQWDESLSIWVATEYITLTAKDGPCFTQVNALYR